MTPQGTVLVSPGGTLLADCLVHLLEAAGVSVTTDDGRADMVAAIVVPWVPRRDSATRLPRLASGVPTLLVASEIDSEVGALMRSGVAGGVVTWESDGAGIVQAVAALLGGTRQAAAAPKLVEADPLRDLTSREHDVVALLARGRRNDEIAEELGISQHTVRTHVQRVLGKLGVPHRHAAAVVARRSPSGGLAARRHGRVAVASGEAS